MSKAVMCPVCQGSGKYYIHPPPGSPITEGSYLPCHGCGGKGWVEVSLNFPPVGRIKEIKDKVYWDRIR